MLAKGQRVVHLLPELPLCLHGVGLSPGQSCERLSRCGGSHLRLQDAAAQGFYGRLKVGSGDTQAAVGASAKRSPRQARIKVRLAM